MEAMLGLFWTAFLAATILPFYSEALLLVLAAQGYDPVALWAWASAGNTLGSVVNWVLARWLSRLEERRWFPVGRRAMERARRWYARAGVASLLFAWAPIGGDALTFIAGWMRVHIVPFVVLVFIGKAARYAVVLLLYEGLR